MFVEPPHVHSNNIECHLMRITRHTRAHDYNDFKCSVTMNNNVITNNNYISSLLSYLAPLSVWRVACGSLLAVAAQHLYLLLWH